MAIGLPNTIPGTDSKTVLDWARRAEERGFSAVATLDRLVYPGHEALVTLGAAAAVTSRIRLTTAIAIVPYRANTALFAKQAATLDSLSEGRLELGMALGAREDDYKASGVGYRQRGQFFDTQLDEMTRIWAGEERGTAGPIGPPPVNGKRPRVLIGGQVDAAFRRVAKYADGWIMGGGTPEQFAEAKPKVEEAWRAEGREGEPKTSALCYYAIDDPEAARKDLLHYYEWLGDVAEQIAASAATSAEMAAGYRDAFAEAGCDELIYFPTSPDVAQVDKLGEAVL